MHISEREMMIVKFERDALQQSSTDLRKEVNYLKEKEAKYKSSKSDFHSYVNLKRELDSLKNENAKLKSSASKHDLKTLKTDVSKHVYKKSHTSS